MNAAGLVAMVALGVVAAEPPANPPQIPAQFSAPFQYEPGLVGFFHQDDTNKRYAQSFSDHQLPGRLSNASTMGLLQNWSFVATTGSLHITVNRVCRAEQGAHYQNFFGWLGEPGVKYVGACVPALHGCPERPCKVWGMIGGGAGGNAAGQEICVDDDNYPVLLKVGKGREWLFGAPVSVGPPPEHVFKLGPFCDKPAPACKKGAVQKLEAVIFHPRGKYNIAGQDVGDMLGDTFFLCAAGPNTSSAGQVRVQGSPYGTSYNVIYRVYLTGSAAAGVRGRVEVVARGVVRLRPVCALQRIPTEMHWERKVPGRAGGCHRLQRPLRPVLG